MQNQDQKRINIYYLVSTRNLLNIKYVGKTETKLKSRLSNHINDAKRRQCHVQNWIKKEINEGYKIQIFLIEECDDSNWEEREIFYIAYYKSLGFNLCNIQEGGKREYITRINNQRITTRPKVYMMDENNNIIREFLNSRDCANILNLPIVGLLTSCKKREEGYDSSCHGYRLTRKPEISITKYFNYWQKDSHPNILQLKKDTKEILRVFTSKSDIYKDLGHHVNTIKKYVNTGKFLKNCNYIFEYENKLNK